MSLLLRPQTTSTRSAWWLRQLFAAAPKEPRTLGEWQAFIAINWERTAASFKVTPPTEP